MWRNEGCGRPSGLLGSLEGGGNLTQRFEHGSVRVVPVTGPLADLTRIVVLEHERQLVVDQVCHAELAVDVDDQAAEHDDLAIAGVHDRVGGPEEVADHEPPGLRELLEALRRCLLTGEPVTPFNIDLLGEHASQGLGVVVGGETRGEGGVELGGLGLAGFDGEVGHAVSVGG